MNLQGVLLLNTVLTVKAATPNSHQKKGWETFTDAICRELAKKEKIVYLLWGNSAQAKVTSAKIDGTKNTIISSSHPSPLGAYKVRQESVIDASLEFKKKDVPFLRCVFF